MNLVHVQPSVLEIVFFHFSAHSRSPSPDTLMDPWQMEMDLVIPVTADLEKPPLTKEELDHRSIAKLSSKLNGTAVTAKKVPSKGEDLRAHFE